MKQLPNIITLLNLFIGCMAVAAAFSGQSDRAAMLVIVCAVLDFLDGTLARVLKAESELGKQLDSLADLVSFGLAPAAIMYYYMRSSPDFPLFGAAAAIHLPALAFLITVFSALRLARFNTDPRQRSSFIGLPTPANALFFISIPLTISFSAQQGLIYGMLVDITRSSLAMGAIILVFSWLLVAPVRMFSLKITSLKLKENSMQYLFVLTVILLFIFVGWESITLIIPVYILISVLSGLRSNL